MNPRPNSNISAVEIEKTLATADLISRRDGEELLANFPEWKDAINDLGEENCSLVTYLPVIAVLLLARSLREKSQLNVLHIQQQTSEFGYSAPSLGARLIPFAVQQNIDLRSTSSQIMNNQPFTFKPEIIPDMAAQHKRKEYSNFYATACKVNELSSSAANDILALLFTLRRKGPHSEIKFSGFDGDSEILSRVVKAASDFVDTNSEAGKVGQVLVAALFDSIYTVSEIRMGNNNDPSSRVPGDIQIGDGQVNWLWAEVKQKVISTPDIQSFVEKVQAAGGQRAAYFALVNSAYPQNIDNDKVQTHSAKIGVVLDVYQSPVAAIDSILRTAPGTRVQVAERFVNAFANRLVEAKVTDSLLNNWNDVVTSLL